MCIQKILSDFDIHMYRIEIWGAAIVLLWARYWLFQDFYNAGLTKVNIDYFLGIFPYFTISENTYILFEYEYQVPLLPSEVAACIASSFELIGSILLLIGLGSRFIAIGFSIMVAVIHFTYTLPNGYDAPEEFVWWILLSFVIVLGAGKFSIDHIIRKKVAE